MNNSSGGEGGADSVLEVEIRKGDTFAASKSKSTSPPSSTHSDPSSSSSSSLLFRKHAKYLSRTLKVMPPSAASFDTSRMTLAFFAIAGLDVLGADLDEVAGEGEAKRCVDWIKSLYVHDANNDRAAFHGGHFLRVDSAFLRSSAHVGHVAMTYTALACLRILGRGSDLESLGVDRRALIRGVAALQRPDGSFDSSTEGGENDMRFVFCAAAVCSMLDCWEGVDKAAIEKYVADSISYEGGIAQGPGMEAHGGSTYCALASLKLMGSLDGVIRPGSHRRKKLVRWCLNRLSEEGGGGHHGFNGRPNKPVDTCYSFWVGASLTILGPFGDDADGKLVSSYVGESTGFVLETQDSLTGGLAKWVDNSTDPLHTYLGLGGLALAEFDGLAAFDPALNITMRAGRGMAVTTAGDA